MGATEKELLAKDQLEDALRACWNFDDLAVYADLLSMDGDPRGELIALDLAPNSEDDAWRTRRDELLASWLGRALARRIGGLVRYGFIHELDDGKLSGGSLAAPILDSPAGAYVRAFVTRGQATKVRASLQRLAQRSRPHLVRMSIHVRDVPGRGSTIDDRAAAALARATPGLASLDVTGRRVLGAFHHPALRRLHLSNEDSLQEVTGVEATGGQLRITCAAGTGRFARAIGSDELRRGLAAVRDNPRYIQLYATHADAFGEQLPAFLARLGHFGMLAYHGPGIVELTSTGKRMLAGGMKLPMLRRPIERPLRHVDRRGTVWLETKNQIAHVGNLRELSRLVCAWLERLPLAGPARDVLDDFLDVLFQIRDDRGRLIDYDMATNLMRVLDQIDKLHADGIDPRRDDSDPSLWATPAWADVRGEAFRELLRAAVGQSLRTALALR